MYQVSTQCILHCSFSYLNLLGEDKVSEVDIFCSCIALKKTATCAALVWSLAIRFVRSNSNCRERKHKWIYFFCIWSKYFKTHYSPINLLVSRFEAYIRSRNIGVAACGLVCLLNVKLSRNQSWENLCFQTRETLSSTRFLIKSSWFSIKGSRFLMKGSRFSILDTRFSQESRMQSRIKTRNRLSTYFWMVLYDKEKASPAIRYQITDDLIRHDGNSFILNIAWGVSVFGLNVPWWSELKIHNSVV